MSHLKERHWCDMTTEPLTPEFDDALLAEHLLAHARWLTQADADVTGTLLARMANVPAAQATVRLKTIAQNAAWRLEIAARQVEALRAQLEASEQEKAAFDEALAQSERAHLSAVTDLVVRLGGADARGYQRGREEVLAKWQEWRKSLS